MERGPCEGMAGILIFGDSSDQTRYALFNLAFITYSACFEEIMRKKRMHLYTTCDFRLINE